MSGRDVVGNAGVSNFTFGPHQPLGQGGHRHKKGGGDLDGGEAAQCLQSERDLLFHRQGRVATGEDQFEAFVGDFARIVVSFADD